MNELLINLSKEGIKPDVIEESSIKFESGYESYEFYRAILASVKERLYVFGRKNRKLFTKGISRIRNLLDNEIDFKCLFLSDKSSMSILKVAQENDSFIDDLKKVLDSVKEKFPNNLECFRKYDFQQTKRIIIIDDVVIFVPVSFENGNVKHFTKTQFEIIPANSNLGINLINEFKKTWDISKSI